jgi:nucleoside-diphosphate-sugar epimerase
MKVFITGGGGFLGSHIVELLLGEGHEITSYSRGHYPELEKKGVKTIQGGLDDLEKLSAACKDHDVFFHTASKVAMWGKSQDFYDTNVVGTQNALKAAKANGIPHFIYTSTPSVVFGDQSLSGVNEETPYPEKSYSRYGHSKAQAEKWVLEQNGADIKTVALRPHLIFGPRDRNLIPRLVDAAKKGRLKMIGDGTNKVDVLYVENAADAHFKAWQALKERPEMVGGQAYFIGQGPVVLWDFINDILNHYQVPPVKKKISFQKAFKIGGLIEKGAEILKVYNWHPPMTRFVALQLSKDHYFDHQKAMNDLGWQPTVSVKEALSRL